MSESVRRHSLMSSLCTEFLHSTQSMHAQSLCLCADCACHRLDVTDSTLDCVYRAQHSAIRRLPKNIGL